MEKVRLCASSSGFLLNLCKLSDPLINIRLSPESKLGAFYISAIDSDFGRKASSFDELKNGRRGHAGFLGHRGDVD